MKHGHNTIPALANHNPMEIHRHNCAHSANPIHPNSSNKKLTPFSGRETVEQHSTHAKSIASLLSIPQKHSAESSWNCGPSPRNGNK
jgi:hypothetical protein